MNVYDSERIEELLTPLGYQISSGAENADLVILNTCHIREKAAEKVYSDLGRIKLLRDKKRESGENMVVIVAGCVAQAEGEEIFRRQPIVDIIVGPQTYHQLPEMLNKMETHVNNNKNGLRDKVVKISAKEKRAHYIKTDFPIEDKFDVLSPMRTSDEVSAFLTIQEGCDKFCTFCVVPYTRGAEFSRPVAEIIKEAKNLVADGVREITLLGQNVNAYHGVGANGKECNLARLIKELADINNLMRIRYTTSHPRDMDDELIEAHGSVDKLMPYLHLPIQSGSNKILKKMNRRHTREGYIRIVEKLRIMRPDIALTSDFIVGFPDESDSDFIETLSLVRNIGYASAFSFKYSPRPGTPIANSDAQIPDIIKSERLSMLQQLLSEQQHSFNKQQQGKTLPILFEKLGRYQGQIVGRSPYLQPVHVSVNESGESLIGQTYHCYINDIKAHSLFGTIINNSMNNTSKRTA